jgi:UDP-3-O-[3-hydroxymyristoyl] glucosamine N-acyltransferase
LVPVKLAQYQREAKIYMKLNKALSVAEIAAIIGAEIIGDPQVSITHLNEIHKVCRGSVIFVDNEKYFSQAIYSSASAIILNKAVECPPNKALLIVDNPFEAYNNLSLRYMPFLPMRATVSDTAVIGEGTIIEPGAVIGNHVNIGKNCLIRANTVICDHTQIGNNVEIYPNSVIGSNAFYYHQKPDKSYEPWHSIGRVVIEDNVRIGACSSVDRGVSGDTIIGEGTKIDDQVHIGHGVVVGKHCIIAAQTGIAGKTIIQDYVTIYGQVGISKGLVIGEGAIILAQTGVSKSIPGGGKRYMGSPAADAMQTFKEMAALRRLPELIKKIDKISTLLGEDKDEKEEKA